MNAVKLVNSLYLCWRIDWSNLWGHTGVVYVSVDLHTHGHSEILHVPSTYVDKHTHRTRWEIWTEKVSLWWSPLHVRWLPILPASGVNRQQSLRLSWSIHGVTPPCAPPPLSVHHIPPLHEPVLRSISIHEVTALNNHITPFSVPSLLCTLIKYLCIKTTCLRWPLLIDSEHQINYIDVYRWKSIHSSSFACNVCRYGWKDPLSLWSWREVSRSLHESSHQVRCPLSFHQLTVTSLHARKTLTYTHIQLHTCNVHTYVRNYVICSMYSINMSLVHAYVHMYSIHMSLVHAYICT